MVGFPKSGHIWSPHVQVAIAHNVIMCDSTKELKSIIAKFIISLATQ